MNNELVNDFINKAAGTDETKEIPEDKNEHIMTIMIPTTTHVVDIDMSWLHENNTEVVSQLYGRLLSDREVMYCMIHDLAEHGADALDSVYKAIIGKAEELSASLHFETEHPKLNKLENTLCMIINVLTYVLELIQYIEAHYDIEVVNTNEIPPADDIDVPANEDEHVVDMLTTEFMDGMDGDEFTKEELYGNTTDDE